MQHESELDCFTKPFVRSNSQGPLLPKHVRQPTQI